MTTHTYLIILCLSTLLQFVAFSISVYALRFTGFRTAWIFIGIATFFMGVRRLITLADVWRHPETYNPHFAPELIALAISALLIAGLGFSLPAIRNLTHRLRRSDENQKALHESEKKYRALIDNTGVGYVILDGKGDVLECNTIYSKLTGHGNSDSILGHNIREWLVAESEDYLLKELEEHCNGALKKYDAEVYRHPDGSETKVGVQSRGLNFESKSRIMALVRDVSKREEAQKKLVTSEKQANLLFENSLISTAIDSPTGQLLRTNKAHDELWGTKV